MIISAGQEKIEISHPDKILFPDANITKGDLAEYYNRIAHTLLLHTRDRPISMQRFPDGIMAEGFYQKEVPDHFPSWIDTAAVPVKEENSHQLQVIVNKPETLIYLANYGMITPHIWSSRVDALDKPDKLVFDLDPPSSEEFGSVKEAASDLRVPLEAEGLTPHVMTTGSRGLHVVVPIERGPSFDEVRQRARALAENLAASQPKNYTTAIRKEKRQGRIFIDFLRNAPAQTTVAPYAVRALSGAPIATPLDWDELGVIESSQAYSIMNIFRRLGQREDPWKQFHNHASPL